MKPAIALLSDFIDLAAALSFAAAVIIAGKLIAGV
jgi:hypothetical protein